MGLHFVSQVVAFYDPLGENCSAGLWLHLWQTTESGQGYISHCCYYSGGRESVPVGLGDNREHTDLGWMAQEAQLLQALLPLSFLRMTSKSNKTTEMFFRPAFSENIPGLTGETRFSICWFGKPSSFLPYCTCCNCTAPASHVREE